jgi:predicted glycosyltransferase
MPITFQEALDTIESLPEYQQEDLVDIIRRRLIERKRDTLVLRVQEARAEYLQGKTKEGTVQDLMSDLAK